MRYKITCLREHPKRISRILKSQNITLRKNVILELKPQHPASFHTCDSKAIESIAASDAAALERWSGWDEDPPGGRDGLTVCTGGASWLMTWAMGGAVDWSSPAAAIGFQFVTLLCC